MKSDPTKVSQLYAIYCAEAVLHIYEDKYTNDNRLRLVIEAAKTYLRNPTDENRDATAANVANAAYDAAAAYDYDDDAAAYYAADAAAGAYYDANAADYAEKSAKKAAELAHETIDFDALKSKAENDILEF